MTAATMILFLVTFDPVAAPPAPAGETTPPAPLRSPAPAPSPRERLACPDDAPTGAPAAALAPASARGRGPARSPRHRSRGAAPGRRRRSAGRRPSRRGDRAGDGRARAGALDAAPGGVGGAAARAADPDRSPLRPQRITWIEPRVPLDTPPPVGLDTVDEVRYEWRASWDLSRIVFNPEELDVHAEALRMADVRRELRPW